MIYYAGIGSRRISVEEELYISDLGKKFSDLGFCLYSGHADGADMTFEKASDPELSVIWLPWEGFNGKLYSKNGIVVGDREEGRRTMEAFHPSPTRLGRGGKALISRNHFQIYGDPPLYPMVDFVVCCADYDGPYKIRGGTGHAIRLASQLGIGWFNIRDLKERKRLDDYISIINM